MKNLTDNRKDMVDRSIRTVYKMMLAIMIVVLVATAVSAQTGECDFMALISQEGTWICDLDDNLDNSSLLEDVGDFFQFLKDSSNPTNNDGYGAVYYEKSDYKITSAQMLHMIGEGVYYSDGIPHHASPLDQFVDNIMLTGYPGNEARIVSGHARSASENPYISGNHPFWLDWDGKTYTFMHNGSISSTLKQNIWAELYNTGWFDEHPSCMDGVPGNVDTWIDSELLFHYLMSFVIQKQGSVPEGIITALTQDSYHNSNVYNEVMVGNNSFNFVMADWTGLYLFKNKEDSNYQMLYKYYSDGYASGLVGVKTGNQLPGGQPVPLRRLLHIPVFGNSTLFESLHLYYTPVNYIFDYPSLRPGCNWVCFPILDDNSGTPVQSLFSQFTAITSPFPFDINADEIIVQFEDDVPAEWYGVQWEPGQTESIESSRGYKVTITDDEYSQFFLYSRGEVLLAPETELMLHDGEANYVPYFLETPQHPSEAFPEEVLAQMISIAAENWFMVRIGDEFYVKEECEPPSQPGTIECYTLNYGMMYEIRMATSMPLIWNQPTGAISKFTPPQAEYFSFETAPDYLKVVIEEIENGEDVIEIGAMQNGECVGAEVVSGYPINLRVYSDNLDGVTYEVITEEPVYRRVPGETAPPARRTLAPAARRYLSGAILLELTDITGLSTTQPSVFSAVTASPNPFNPSTEISFLLNQSSEVILKVYNIRGQLVSTLLQGSLESGFYSCSWDGSSAASGVYYFQLSDGTDQIGQKLILLK